MGGNEHKSNLKRVTLKQHAEEHRLLYEKYGKKEDLLAYRGLSGQIGKEEIIHHRKSIGGQNSAKQRTSEHYRQLANKLWSKPGMREHLSNKRKEQVNPMQGKKQRQCCCIICKRQVWNHTLKNHLRSHNIR
tara:strand:+ start:114 stop:509 length:396 start_codon:yes stop_codon:yes gene_type:complete